MQRTHTAVILALLPLVGLAALSAAGPGFGLGCKAVKTCKIKEVRLDGGVDAYVPWWSDASTCDASSCQPTNECGGYGVLALLPGESCGSCGGHYECDGPDSVRCVDSCSDIIGCSDGEREAFTDTTAFPNVAGCSGGWSSKGILGKTPLCSRISGDDSPNPSGIPCSAADLCADGWRVCDSLAEFAASSPGGCTGDIPAGSFYVAAVSGDGDEECTSDGTNDLFGCGTMGLTAAASCTPLTRCSGDECEDLSGEWDCPGSFLVGSDSEAEDVRKNGPGGGGVLCCRVQQGQ